MFMIRIWNYFRGYAIIIVEGLKIERFINLAVVSGIYIWDIRRKSYTAVEAKIGLDHFSRLRDITKRTGTTVQIVGKRGFPFFVKNMKRKKVLYIGLLMLFIFIYIISCHVWMIEVSGNKTVETKAIMEKLNKLGLVEGTLKGRIDKAKMENRMLVIMPELSLIEIQIHGTKAIVHVTEKKKEPEPVKTDEPCNIIAGKNGAIDRLFVLKGDPVVKDGDVVKKGQVLVTGMIQRENMDVRFVHSMAQAMARTWYEEAEEMALTKVDYKKTGRKDTHYKLVILNKAIYRKKPPVFADYNQVKEVKNLLSFGDFIFPVKLEMTQYEELKPYTQKITVQEAKNRCAERLNGKIKVLLPENAVILKKKIDYLIDKNSVKAKIWVEAMEDIAIKQKIDQ